MRARILDYETTGIHAPAQVIEAAYIDIVLDGGVWFEDCHDRAFFKSSVPVHPQARAAHQITDEEIASGYPQEWLTKFVHYKAPDIFVAHNMSFEKKFLPLQGLHVCTFKCAKALWPNAPSHKNQELPIWKCLELDEARCRPAHRALPDCYVTMVLLLHMLETGNSMDKLVRLSGGMAPVTNVADVPVTLDFGIHKGKTLNAVPTHYLKWIVTESNCRQFVKDMAARELDRR